MLDRSIQVGVPASPYLCKCQAQPLADDSSPPNAAAAPGRERPAGVTAPARTIPPGPSGLAGILRHVTPI
jgi:hypothetical protein